MASLSRARRNDKKQRFLQALAACGTFGTAARAARISRDAAHDWRRNDPDFAAACDAALRAFARKPERDLAGACAFFSSVVRPLIPSAWWENIARALQDAIRIKACAGTTSPAAPSRHGPAPMPPLSSLDRSFMAGHIGARPVFNVLSEMDMR